MKKNNLVKLFVGSLLTFSFIRGIHRFVFELEDNKCEMTFMFEYPQYIVSVLPLPLLKIAISKNSAIIENQIKWTNINWIP